MTRFACLFLVVACSSNSGPPAEDGGADASMPDAGSDVSVPDAADEDAGTDAGDDDAGDGDAGDAGDDVGADTGGDACPPPVCPAPPEGCSYVGTDPCECGELVCDGIECTDDDDCPGGFCRATMTEGLRQCHPWADEGDSCGGFTLPWAVERCDPSVHTCMSISPLIADAPGTCLLEVTVAELVADPSMYTGRVVGVRTSWVTNGFSACTEIACPAEMPCCNDCSAGMLAYDVMDGADSVSLFDGDGVAYTCMGDDCEPIRTCTVERNQSYRIIGTFDGTGIRVSSIQRVSF